MKPKVSRMICPAFAVIVSHASAVTAYEQSQPQPKAASETPAQSAMSAAPGTPGQPASPAPLTAKARAEPAASARREKPTAEEPGALATGTVEPADLEEITVYGKPITAPTKETNDTVYTGTEVTRKGMELGGSKSSISVYSAADVLPGISVERADPYGLETEQANVRVRGVRGTMGSITVEGVPNWGGNPIGPRDYLYDTENMESVAVYKGAAPADLGTGTGGRGGLMELRPRWPQLESGGDIGMGVGVYDYHRGYYRLDSGVLPLVGTSASVSYSYTIADKWKGPGRLGPRKNANLMLRQPVWGQDEIKAWLNFNDLEQDLYRSLSYEQTRNLDANYETDYQRRLTGQQGQDIFYYRNNRSALTNLDALALVPVTIDETYYLSFKPYLSLEDSEILSGSPAQGGGVIKRLRNFLRAGLISKVGARHKSGDLSLQAALGYLLEGSDLSVNTENYHPTTFEYLGWGNYGKSDGIGMQHSPYLKVAVRWLDLNLQAGVKYFYYSDPGSTGYRYNPQSERLDRDPGMDRDRRSYDGLFPSFGASYQFVPELGVHASYGRNFLRPYAYQPLLTLYNQYPDRFEAAGVTLNDMFEGYGMETSDNFDFGARWKTDWFLLAPTFFLSLHRNLLTSVYDPRVDLNYNQNVGKATGYGCELAANLFLARVVTLFINPTYTRLTYDEKLNSQGNTVDIQGNQVVDTPEWAVKTGLIVEYGELQAVLMIRYMGERYGDIEHKEKIDGHLLADASLSYAFRDAPIVEQTKLSLEFQNLFDTRYVSVITASDYNREGTTGYYVGAPFTALLKASVEF